MNVFRGGDGRSLEMTNSGTAVFVDVLSLAVAALAREPWHFRFAALLTLQNQNVMGRGVVGFGLADLDRGDGPEERAAAKEFLLSLDLALSRHRWEELAYEAPRAEGHLRAYRAMVEAFDPATARTGAGVLPGPEEAAMAPSAQRQIQWLSRIACRRRSPSGRVTTRVSSWYESRSPAAANTGASSCTRKSGRSRNQSISSMRGSGVTPSQFTSTGRASSGAVGCGDGRRGPERTRGSQRRVRPSGPGPRWPG